MNTIYVCNTCDHRCQYTEDELIDLGMMVEDNGEYVFTNQLRCLITNKIPSLIKSVLKQGEKIIQIKEV